MTKRFPIQGCGTVAWEAAEKAHAIYVAEYGPQPLETIAERGGFSVVEFVLLWHGYPPRRADVRSPTRGEIEKMIVRTTLLEEVDWQV